MIWKYVRAGGRLIHISWVLLSVAVVYFFTVRLRGKSGSIAARALWMQASAVRLLNSMNIRVTSHGAPPAKGLLAANHLSYLDIAVLGSVQPMVFLSKSEVRKWPVFGFLANLAGTLFIRRDKKADVARFGEPFGEVVNAGVVLAIFPEGTSSDGHRVLPFHSSLFEAAAAAQWPVTPAWIGYEMPKGSVENEVCYWGDMTFLAHFLHLATVDQVNATVVFGGILIEGLDRKQMAKQLHREVCELAGKHRPDWHSISSRCLQGDLPAAR